MLVSRALVAGLALLLLPVDHTSYRAEIEKWRHQREQALKAEDGWLTVAGLFWLKEGENTIGSNRGNNFVLPKASAQREWVRSNSITGPRLSRLPRVSRQL